MTEAANGLVPGHSCSYCSVDKLFRKLNFLKQLHFPGENIYILIEHLLIRTYINRLSNNIIKGNVMTSLKPNRWVYTM